MTMSVLELRLFSGDRRIVDSIISQLGFLNKNNTLLLHDSGLVTQTHFRCTEHWQKVIKRSGISWWLVWAKSAKNFSGTRVTRSICEVIFISLLVLKLLTQKSGFSTGEILHKYV
ncbi:uncharacterized protein LOC110930561 isoform X4 [Helianthus annuus]|uniref:uncharacterized protein LOC110930561 isoform X4 n=1 Tax=Helianthus annuus TaxID=4232 RepID=UPI000B8F0C24|nr:uncharacterized protein LOC110930561 isoform X4 [Helianthus annuus]